MSEAREDLTAEMIRNHFNDPNSTLKLDMDNFNSWPEELRAVALEEGRKHAIRLAIKSIDAEIAKADPNSVQMLGLQDAKARFEREVA